MDDKKMNDKESKQENERQENERQENVNSRGRKLNDKKMSDKLSRQENGRQKTENGRQSIGPERLSVHDSHSRTNNVLETYHSTLRRRIKVTHPNLFIFLSQLSKATTDYMNDMARIDNGLRISRPKNKWILLNEASIKACITKFNARLYSRLQFLRAVCHSVGAHTDVLQRHQ